MKKKLKEEFNLLLLSGRTLSESEFDKKIDDYLAGQTEDSKEILRECIIEWYAEKTQEMKAILDEIRLIKLHDDDGRKKKSNALLDLSGNTKSVAMEMA